MRLLLLHIVLLSWVPFSLVLAEGIHTNRVILKLVRVDRLPTVYGKYQLDLVISNEERFPLVKEEIVSAPDTGRNPADLFICSWGQKPSAKSEARWTYGSAHVCSSPDDSWIALMTRRITPNDTSNDRLFLLHHLKSHASIDFTEHDAYLRCISNQGEAVLKTRKDTNTAIFVKSDSTVSRRTYPEKFLQWNFDASQALCARDRLMIVFDDDDVPVLEVSLPFMVEKASSFGQGRILVGSRSIAKDGPSWRVLLSPTGKILGEGIFGYWDFLPARQAVKGFCCAFHLDATGARKPSPYIAVLRSRDRWHSENRIEIIDKKNLSRTRSFASSDAFHAYNCFDSRGNVYSLVDEQFPDDHNNEREMQKVVKTAFYGKPTDLLTGKEVAGTLDKESVWIYSITVSRDGNWLALLVSPPGHFESKEPWQLLQYKIQWPSKSH